MENIYQIQLYGANPESEGSKALVSIEKINDVISYKWYLGKDGYPFAYIKGARIPLHRYIWFINTGIWSNNYIDENSQIKKLYIDHINRNKLDATDSNLRLSTPAENSYNKSTKITDKTIIDPITGTPLHHIKLIKSGYQIIINKNKQINKIDNIKSLEEAKEIYNIMASELFGQYAVLY